MRTEPIYLPDIPDHSSSRRTGSPAHVGSLRGPAGPTPQPQPVPAADEERQRHRGGRASSLHRSSTDDQLSRCDVSHRAAAARGIKRCGLLPLGLAILGGLLGGAVGAVGVLANLAIIRTVPSTAVKALLMSAYWCWPPSSGWSCARQWPPRRARRCARTARACAGHLRRRAPGPPAPRRGTPRRSRRSRADRRPGSSPRAGSAPERPAWSTTSARSRTSACARSRPPRRPPRSSR